MEEERYPQRERKPPSRWCAASALTKMVGTTNSNIQIQVTTSDEPTLKGAMLATLEGEELWMDAIED